MKINVFRLIWAYYIDIQIWVYVFGFPFSRKSLDAYTQLNDSCIHTLALRAAVSTLRKCQEENARDRKRDREEKLKQETSCSHFYYCVLLYSVWTQRTAVGTCARTIFYWRIIRHIFKRNERNTYNEGLLSLARCTCVYYILSYWRDICHLCCAPTVNAYAFILSISLNTIPINLC